MLAWHWENVRCFSLEKLKTLSPGLTQPNQHMGSMNNVVWVRLSDQSIGNSVINFAFCLWKVLAVLGQNSRIVVTVCFALAEFSLSRNIVFPVFKCNMAFRRLGLHWISVCSAPSKVQFVYCHLRSF